MKGALEDTQQGGDVTKLDSKWMGGWFWGWVEHSQQEAAKLQGHNEDTVVAASVTEMGREMVETQNPPALMSSLPKGKNGAWQGEQG